MLALILFFVLAVIPILLFLSVVIMRISVKFSVKCNSGVITKGEKGNFLVNIKNRSFFPITKIILFGTYSNSFFNKPDSGEICFWIPPFSSKNFDMEISSEHAGNIKIAFTKARVYDYFGVFSLPFKVKQEFVYSVVPPFQMVNVKLSPNMYTISESNVFSKHKAGDDPSEVFQIRDYVGGDKLNRIHWKLSSKHDNFIVKDYSLPISESALILVELCCDMKSSSDLDLIDTVLESAFSLSNIFIDNGTAHTIGWYNTVSKSIFTYKIEGIDDLYSAIGMIYNNTSYYSEPYLAQLDADEQKNMSHVIYIAPNISDKHCGLITATMSETCIFELVNVIPEGSDSEVVSTDDFNVIPVIPGKLTYCLYID